MSTTPTVQQIADLRADIGDVGSEQAFTDDEITRIWARVSGASDDYTQHRAAMALMIEQLLSQAVKLTTYHAGSIAENLSDVRKGLEAQHKLYEPSLKAALGIGLGFAKSTMRPKPRQNRTYPDDGRW
jgi:hypothetical protein